MYNLSTAENIPSKLGYAIATEDDHSAEMFATIEAHIERLDTTAIQGWLWVPDEPLARLRLEVFYQGVPIGECTANEFRPDLEHADIGDGAHGFFFRLPAAFPRSELEHLRVRVKGMGILNAKGITNGIFDSPTSHSQFGRLWIDQLDWIDRLALKNRRRELSDELSEIIFRFVRDGFVIFKQAVPLDVVHRVNADIEELWQNPPEGLLIETFEPDSIQKYIPPDIALRGKRTKFLDTYAFSANVRAATAAPRVRDFLKAIFEDTPKAFQSLSFHTGSQQAIHKDSAYVKIDTAPMHLAATWLALENIEAGTGELEYYVGSHRAPEFLFGGVHKWMENFPAQGGEFLESLHKDAQKYEHVRSSFLAEAGDVLVWHADLAHGGAKILNNNKTRKSLVTHITAARDEPFYRRTSQNAVMEINGFQFVSSYTNIR